MERQFITAVPAYGSAEAGEVYRGLMPLLGQDMSDEYPIHVGLTLVKGYFTTWVEMHRLNFRCDPESNLEPRVLGNKEDKELHERWMQWVNDSLFEVREDHPDASIIDLERVVRWGGVTPFKITDTTCRVCAKVGSIVPVIAPMCWPANEVDMTDDRRPWDYTFPAEHLRVEVGSSHDRDGNALHRLVDELWEEEKESGWEPYEESDQAIPVREWTISDLYEAGYEDEVHQLEENATEIHKVQCREKHADIVHIPHRVYTDWINLIDRQAKSYITRTNSQSRQITFAVEEGLREWRGATGH